MPLCLADVQLHLHRARSVARAPAPTTCASLARNDNTPGPNGEPSGVSALYNLFGAQARLRGISPVEVFFDTEAIRNCEDWRCKRLKQ